MLQLTIYIYIYIIIRLRIKIFTTEWSLDGNFLLFFKYSNFIDVQIFYKYPPFNCREKKKFNINISNIVIKKYV